jgi:hypothetical protein
MSGRGWFDTDHRGLGKVLGERSKTYLLGELWANGWDEKSTRLETTVAPVPGRSLVEVVVIDDSPEGFSDLAHAYTLFAESEKKSDPNKRGWRNFGEKLVIASCESSSISTTTGTVYFEKDGTRRRTKERTKAGSVFRGLVKMTRAELAALCEDARRFIAPIPTMFNDELLPQHKELASFEIALPTVIADEEGEIKRTRRKTTATVYEPIEKGVGGWLYEMGVPVQSMGDDKFDVDIGQKVPLGLDKKGVSPSYLREVRVAVLNATHHLLSKDDATSTWVGEATDDERCSNDAIAIKPAGQIGGLATPRPYSDDPLAPPVEVIPEQFWTEDQRWTVGFAMNLHRELLSFEIAQIRIVRAPNFGACYGNGCLDLSVRRLGSKWFAGPIEPIVDLLIHEFAHHIEANHLSDRYFNALTKLAGLAVGYALRRPGDFKR